MSKRTSREIMADGFEEVDARLSAIERTLADIKRIVVDLADAQSEHRHATRDAVDRLGTRVLTLERLAQNGGE